MTEKIRLDLLLKEKYDFSRQYAQELIQSEKVFVNGKKITKPGFSVLKTDIIALADNSMPKYAGRGGYKLEKAINEFSLFLNGLVCIDIGSSTGGFTDCMLQNGAEKVYAVDVGTNQLVPSLRENNRVVCLEQTDIRDVTADMLNGRADFIGADVSFISIVKIADSITALLKPEGIAVVLLKPQFEAGRENISKSGVVRNPKIHKRVFKNITSLLSEKGLFLKNLTYSPIKGGEGNIEYLLLLTQEEDSKLTACALTDKIDLTVDTAFEKLKGGKV